MASEALLAPSQPRGRPHTGINEFHVARGVSPNTRVPGLPRDVVTVSRFPLDNAARHTDSTVSRATAVSSGHSSPSLSPGMMLRSVRSAPKPNPSGTDTSNTVAPDVTQAESGSVADLIDTERTEEDYPTRSTKRRTARAEESVPSSMDMPTRPMGRPSSQSRDPPIATAQQRLRQGGTRTHSRPQAGSSSGMEAEATTDDTTQQQQQQQHQEQHHDADVAFPSQGTRPRVDTAATATVVAADSSTSSNSPAGAASQGGFMSWFAACCCGGAAATGGLPPAGTYRIDTPQPPPDPSTPAAPAGGRSAQRAATTEVAVSATTITAQNAQLSIAEQPSMFTASRGSLASSSTKHIDTTAATASPWRGGGRVAAAPAFAAAGDLTSGPPPPAGRVWQHHDDGDDDDDGEIGSAVPARRQGMRGVQRGRSSSSGRPMRPSSLLGSSSDHQTTATRNPFTGLPQLPPGPDATAQATNAPEPQDWPQDGRRRAKQLFLAGTGTDEEDDPKPAHATADPDPPQGHSSSSSKAARPRSNATELEAPSGQQAAAAAAAALSSSYDDDDDDSPIYEPPPKPMTVDPTRRDRQYMRKVAEYKQQAMYRIKVFADQAIQEAQERGRRIWRATPASKRPSSPRPTLLDPERMSVPLCAVCGAVRAELVTVPCDHCAICKQCAARHRVMSSSSAAAERQSAKFALENAQQALRSLTAREEELRLAQPTTKAAAAAAAAAASASAGGSGSGSSSPSTSYRELLAAERREAARKLEEARFLLLCPATTKCVVCNFRIDAMLSLTRIAQLHRTYSGGARLTSQFRKTLRDATPSLTPKVKEAFETFQRERQLAKAGADEDAIDSDDASSTSVD